MNKDPLGREALRAVARDGVAVVEMTVLVGGELDLAVVVQAGREATIGLDRLNGCHVAIRNA